VDATPKIFPLPKHTTLPPSLSLSPHLTVAHVQAHSALACGRVLAPHDLDVFSPVHLVIEENVPNERPEWNDIAREDIGCSLPPTVGAELAALALRVHQVALVQPAVMGALGDVALAIGNAWTIATDPKKEGEEVKGRG